MALDETVALSKGEKVVVRIKSYYNEKTKRAEFNGETSRKIKTNSNTVLGVVRSSNETCFLIPVNKKEKDQYTIDKNTIKAVDGDLVEANFLTEKSGMSRRSVNLIKKLTNNNVNTLSSIAIQQHDIPNSFSDRIIAEANQVTQQKITNPTDLTRLPFVSIDPTDARDLDDAIYAAMDEDNLDQYIVWVAVADVAKYVLPQSELDQEAYKRGNSTYFPDLAIPMLPDVLSSNICSLKENTERASIVVKIVIDSNGQKVSHQFFRATIKTRYALSYEEAEAAQEIPTDTNLDSDLTKLLKPLFEVYELLKKQRKIRQPLVLEIDEQLMTFNDNQTIKAIKTKKPLKTHKLVEEIMILANICAGETIKQSGLPCLYRVHEPPTLEKFYILKNFSNSLNMKFNSRLPMETSQFNDLIKDGKAKGLSDLASMSILRSMSQAHYSPKNRRHFGLNLETYIHFTSPIRRYSDILAHRALILIHGWNKKTSATPEKLDFEKIGSHLSRTERRSVLAERDTTDRYVAAFLENFLGSDFSGSISGLSRNGIFVRLCKIGGDGLIPISSVSYDRFILNRTCTRMVGKHSKLSISIGAPVLVKVVHTNPVSGGLIFNLVEYNGKVLDRYQSKRQTQSKKRSVRRRHQRTNS